MSTQNQPLALEEMLKLAKLVKAWPIEGLNAYHGLKEWFYLGSIPNLNHPLTTPLTVKVKRELHKDPIAEGSIVTYTLSVQESDINLGHFSRTHQHQIQEKSELAQLYLTAEADYQKRHKEYCEKFSQTPKQKHADALQRARALME